MIETMELHRCPGCGDSTRGCEPERNVYTASCVACARKARHWKRQEQIRCTGVTASWCGFCGDCSCPRTENNDVIEQDRICPLHGEDSEHADLNPPGE